MLHISTPYLDYYKVDDKGRIINANDGCNGSDDWLFLGISHVKRNDFIPFKHLKKFLESKPNLLWKNGNPQWTVRDLDHGTTREWGNTQYHGIKGLWFDYPEKFFVEKGEENDNF